VEEGRGEGLGLGQGGGEVVLASAQSREQREGGKREEKERGKCPLSCFYPWKSEGRKRERKGEAELKKIEGNAMRCMCQN
jgi:hypothetical protein